MTDPLAARRFVFDITEVRAARQFVRDSFQSWQATGSEDAELVVSELVSNAIIHAVSAPEVRLLLRSDRVRIEVDDDSDDDPQLLTASGDGTSRGMAIVEHLALSWGFLARPGGGKTVWVEMPRW